MSKKLQREETSHKRRIELSLRLAQGGKIDWNYIRKLKWEWVTNLSAPTALVNKVFFLSCYLSLSLSHPQVATFKFLAHLGLLNWTTVFYQDLRSCWIWLRTNSVAMMIQQKIEECWKVSKHLNISEKERESDEEEVNDVPHCDNISHVSQKYNYNETTCIFSSNKYQLCQSLKFPLFYCYFLWNRWRCCGIISRSNVILKHCIQMR